MHLHLLIPFLAWPHPPAGQPDPARQPLPPALARLLARAGSVRRGAAAGADAWLFSAFGVAGRPVAAATLLADGEEPGGDVWMRADPVHLQLARDALVLVDSQAFRLAQDEAESLADAFNTHFAADGLRLEVRRPDRWYLRLSGGTAPVTTPLPDVVGRSIDPWLPRAASGLAWPRLLNEIQMLFHGHPVNEAREARGEPPVNSLWFWGEGALPAVSPSAFAQIWSDLPVARGLALAAGQPARSQPADAGDWLAQSLSPGGHLVTLPLLEGAGQFHDPAGWLEGLARLERDWFAPLLDALRAGRVRSLAVTATGPDGSATFTVRRADLWKFWRRRPLAALR